MVREIGFALGFVVATGATYGQQAAGGWQKVAESFDSNYSVICSRAKEQAAFYSVSPRTPNVEYRVARDISVLYGPDGHASSISLMRGLASGNYHDVVTLGGDASCIIEKQ